METSSSADIEKPRRYWNFFSTIAGGGLVIYFAMWALAFIREDVDIQTFSAAILAVVLPLLAYAAGIAGAKPS